MMSGMHGGRGADEGGRNSRRADVIWLLGYILLFLAPCLILFTVRLYAVAGVWFGLWLIYLLFVVRNFSRVRTKRESR